MDTEKSIKAAAAYAGMTQADIAKAMGVTKQGFHSKLKRNSFKDEELTRIAEVIGAEYVARFRFPDGTEI